MNNKMLVITIGLITAVIVVVIGGLFSVGWLESVEYKISDDADSFLYIDFPECKKGIIIQNSTGSRICLSQDDLYDMAQEIKK